MKDPKNIRIILVPIKDMERRDMENIENTKFKNTEEIFDSLFNVHSKRKETAHLSPLILTPSEFRTQLAFQPSAHKSFSTAISNIRKRKQCYNLSEFMDDFNNQEFGGETDKYWMGYVKLK